MWSSKTCSFLFVFSFSAFVLRFDVASSLLFFLLFDHSSFSLFTSNPYACFILFLCFLCQFFFTYAGCFLLLVHFFFSFLFLFSNTFLPSDDAVTIDFRTFFFGALNWQVGCRVLRQYVRLIWWYLLEKKREGNIWQTADLEQLLVGVGGRNSDSCCFKLVSYRGIDTKWGGSNDRLAIGTRTWEGKNVIKHETVL